MCVVSQTLAVTTIHFKNQKEKKPVQFEPVCYTEELQVRQNAVTLQYCSLLASWLISAKNTHLLAYTWHKTQEC